MVHYLDFVKLLVALEMLEVHGPDGQKAFVSVTEISSLRAPNSFDLRRHFPAKTKCVVVMGNGKFLAVTESCEEIRDMLKGSAPP